MHVPEPAPRRERKLPWVAMALGSAVGLALFLWLWGVAVDIQRENAPKVQPRTWTPPPP
ncbi:MAG: hypothetical protein HY904_17005 [Deltaproteobacteria bacterium]|nr:hypothetical protein [Deltaproteobacteria bacterium]